MPVEMSQALRVLAHELRSPAGVAQGYIRMLLEERLQSPDDRRRALEQVRDVIGRIGALSREASDAAAWLDREPVELKRVEADAVLQAAVRQLPAAAAVTATRTPGPGMLIETPDRDALASALAAVLAALVRERPNQALTLDADTTISSSLLLAAGPADLLPALKTADRIGLASRFTLERGGLGLSLVNAAFVLDSHRARWWTLDQRRDACAIQLPLAA